MKLRSPNSFVRFLFYCTCLLFTVAVSAQQGAPTVVDIRWNTDGIRLAIAYQFGPVEVIDAQTGETMISISSFNRVNAVDWRPLHADVLAMAGSTPNQSGIVQLINASTGQVIRTLDGGYDIVDAKWSPDGSKIAASSAPMGVSPTSRDEVLIWDGDTGELFRSIPTIEYGAAINSIDWSPDGTQIAGATSASVVVVWDAVTGEVVSILPHNNVVLSLAWSPDNQYLATGSFDVDNVVRIWSAATWQLLATYPANYTSDLAWNTANELAIAENGRIRVVNVTNGQEIAQLLTNNFERAVAFSPYGGRLAFGGETNPDSVLRPQVTNASIVLDTGEVQIIIPDTSSEHFDELLNQCASEPLTTTSVDEAIAQNDLASVIEQVQRMPESAIPKACAVDLMAIAEALQALD